MLIRWYFKLREPQIWRPKEQCDEISVIIQRSFQAVVNIILKILRVEFQIISSSHSSSSLFVKNSVIWNSISFHQVALSSKKHLLFYQHTDARNIPTSFRNSHVLLNFIDINGTTDIKSSQYHYWVEKWDFPAFLGIITCFYANNLMVPRS